VTLAVLIYTFWDFSRAASQEEILLKEVLPDYAVYMAQTPQFFPRIGKKL
jgi:protein-S-isoprenylcysteine O-methyltransferase Ste14